MKRKLGIAGKAVTRKLGNFDFRVGFEKSKEIIRFINLIIFNREAIQEDDDGIIESNVAELVARAKRKRAEYRASGTIQLGMMRHLFVIIDASECMMLQGIYCILN